jgi:hypothetical protein
VQIIEIIYVAVGLAACASAARRGGRRALLRQASIWIGMPLLLVVLSLIAYAAGFRNDNLVVAAAIVGIAGWAWLVFWKDPAKP